MRKCTPLGLSKNKASQFQDSVTIPSKRTSKEPFNLGHGEAIQHPAWHPREIEELSGDREAEKLQVLIHGEAAELQKEQGQPWEAG